MFYRTVYKVTGSFANGCVFAFHPFPIERATGIFEDMSGRNQTATYMVSGSTPAAAPITYGRFGRAVTLNGSNPNDKIQVGRDGVNSSDENGSNFLNLTYPFSVTAVFKRTNNTSNIQGVITKNAAGTVNAEPNGWWMACSRDAYGDGTFGTGRVWFRMARGVPTTFDQVVSPASSLIDGADETAVTVVGTGNNTAGQDKTLDLWKDGVLIATTTTTVTIGGHHTGGVYIGQFAGVGGVGFALGGNVSYAFIHKRGLTPQEIGVLHFHPERAFQIPQFKPNAGRLYYIGSDQRSTGVNVALDAQLHDAVVDLAAHLALSEKPSQDVNKEAFLERAKMFIGSVTGKTEAEVKKVAEQVLGN